MQITRQTEYAIRTILELAKAEPGRLLTAKYISGQQRIPELFLKKTISLLAHAGLIATQRGAEGGIRLITPPGKISLADIVIAVEGRMALNVCLTEDYVCPNKPLCRVRQTLQRAQEAMLVELSKESVTDLLTGQAELNLTKQEEIKNVLPSV